jgi:hypothetical protein
MLRLASLVTASPILHRSISRAIDKDPPVSKVKAEGHLISACAGQTCARSISHGPLRGLTTTAAPLNSEGTRSARTWSATCPTTIVVALPVAEPDDSGKLMRRSVPNAFLLTLTHPAAVAGCAYAPHFKDGFLPSGKKIVYDRKPTRRCRSWKRGSERRKSQAGSILIKVR